MSHPLAFLLCILIFTFSSAQEVVFHDVTFAEALESQSDEHRFIFVQITGAKCSVCDELTAKAMSKEVVAEKYAKDALCLRVHKDSPSAKEIWNRYRIWHIPTNIIFNRKGEYLGHLNGSTTNVTAFLQLMEKAEEYEHNPPLKRFQDALSQGQADKILLKEYLQILASFDLYKGDILDKYVDYLTVLDLNDFSEMEFVFSMAPLVNSKAMRVLNFDRELKEHIYSMHQGDRMAHRVNGMITFYSSKKATMNGDNDYIRKVASWRRGTYTNNWEAGMRTYLGILRTHYHETRQEELFKENVQETYHRFYAHLDPDSMRSVELGEIPLGLKRGCYGEVLNSLAWQTYLLSTDRESLDLAWEMIEKALTYYEDPSLLDTKARLAYKRGDKEMAIAFQEMAIKKLRDNGLVEVPATFTDALAKMKDDSLLDDLQ